MAIYLNGMDDNEQEILTDAMLHSGNTLDFLTSTNQKLTSIHRRSWR